MNETEKKRLLAELVAATTSIRVAKDRRRTAVRAAMDAGIPRAEIAETLGVSRSRLYQIIDQD